MKLRLGSFGSSSANEKTDKLAKAVLQYLDGDFSASTEFGGTAAEALERLQKQISHSTVQNDKEQTNLFYGYLQILGEKSGKVVRHICRAVDSQKTMLAEADRRNTQLNKDLEATAEHLESSNRSADEIEKVIHSGVDEISK